MFHFCLPSSFDIIYSPEGTKSETDVRIPDQTFPRQNQEDFGILSTDGVAHGQ